MDRALPLASLAMALGLVGCSAGSGAFYPADADMAGNPNDQIGACTTVVSLSPKNAATGTTLQANAHVEDGMGLVYDLSWLVSRAGVQQPVPFQTVDATDITIVATDGGSYTVQVQAQSRDGTYRCVGSDTAIVSPPGAKTRAYRVRVTPSVATGLPRQETVLTLTGGTPLDGQSLAVAAGVPVDAALVGPSGGIAGTVRFIDAAGLDVIAPAAVDGSFHTQLLPNDGYTAILVPASPDLAPHAFTQPMPGAVLASSVFGVTAGGTISGTVVDVAGKPVANARLALESPMLSSSVGASDAGGAFTLHAEPGAYHLVASAPGLPSLTAPLAVFDDGSIVAIRYQTPLVAVAAKVLASDGTTPMAATRVTLRSQAAIAGAAQVTVAGAQPVSVDGPVKVTVVTAADGTLPPLALPAGDYDVLLEPPASVEDGITAASVTVAASGASWDLQLVPHATLTGTVSDARGPVAGALVTGLEQVGLGAAPTTVTDAQGYYALVVDAAVDVDVVVDPPAGVGPDLRAHALVHAGSLTQDVLLTDGMFFGGWVTPPSGAAVPDALVEFFCTQCDDTLPLAWAVSGSDGKFTMYVPDPGL